MNDILSRPIASICPPRRAKAEPLFELISALGGIRALLATSFIGNEQLLAHMRSADALAERAQKLLAQMETPKKRKRK